MFLPPHQAAELCWLAQQSDREARSDLALGFIRHEDDYTSTFVGSLRRNVNSYSQTGLTAHSYMVSSRVERRTGCDAAIIVSSNGRSKVALFEAKLPALMSGGGTWDYPQTATGLSHFSDQLQRQAILPGPFAVFEMFYCEYAFGSQPSYMDDDLSSCVWRDDAIAFDEHRPGSPKPWGKQDLVGLLSRTPKMTVVDVLDAIAVCKVGSPRPRMDGQTFAGEFQFDGYVLEIAAGRQ